MSMDDAKRTIKGMGNAIKHNAPGPSQLWQGFLETHVYSPALPFLILIALMLLFAQPLIHWWVTKDMPCPQPKNGIVSCPLTDLKP